MGKTGGRRWRRSGLRLHLPMPVTRLPSCWYDFPTLMLCFALLCFAMLCQCLNPASVPPLQCCTQLARLPRAASLDDYRYRPQEDTRGQPCGLAGWSPFVRGARVVASPAKNNSQLREPTQGVPLYHESLHKVRLACASQLNSGPPTTVPVVDMLTT